MVAITQKSLANLRPYKPHKNGGGKENWSRGKEMQRFIAQHDLARNDKMRKIDIILDVLYQKALTGNVPAIALVLDCAYGKQRDTDNNASINITVMQPVNGMTFDIGDSPSKSAVIEHNNGGDEITNVTQTVDSTSK